MNNQHQSKQPRREDYQQAIQSLDTYIDITVDDLMDLTERAKQIASRRVAESLSIAQVMSQPLHCVKPQTLLTEAAHLMVSKHVSGLPVVDDDRRLVGLITEADFLRALGVPSQQPSHNVWQTLEALFAHLAHHAELETPTDPVALHMVRKVQCVRPDQTLQHVLEMMKEHWVKRVVVCDADQRVLGMVTRSDLVRVFFDRFT